MAVIRWRQRTAIARCARWMTTGPSGGTISLVGQGQWLAPRAIRSAQAKGMLIVAAVGNDGPAGTAPLPAALQGRPRSDRRRSPEFGRCRKPHCYTGSMFAAPGADIKARHLQMEKNRGHCAAHPCRNGCGPVSTLYYPPPICARIETAVNGLIGEARDPQKRAARQGLWQWLGLRELRDPLDFSIFSHGDGLIGKPVRSPGR